MINNQETSQNENIGQIPVGDYPEENNDSHTKQFKPNDKPQENNDESKEQAPISNEAEEDNGQTTLNLQPGPNLEENIIDRAINENQYKDKDKDNEMNNNYTCKCKCCESCLYNCNNIYETLFDKYDNNEYIYYNIPKILFAFLIQNIIFLILFILYKNKKDSYEYYFGSSALDDLNNNIIPCIPTFGGSGGIAFDIIKYKQYKNDEYIRNDNICVTVILFIFLTGTKAAIHALYYIIICYGFPDIIMEPELDSLFTFIFPIVYYITLITYISYKKGNINFALFFFIGFIYYLIMNLILFLLTKSTNDLISNLIFMSLEIISLNFGIYMAKYKNTLQSDYIMWNILHIEVYRLYPILAILGFFAFLTFIGIILGCFVALCYLYLRRGD